MTTLTRDTSELPTTLLRPDAPAFTPNNRLGHIRYDNVDNKRATSHSSDLILPNTSKRRFAKLGMMLHGAVNGQVGQFCQDTNHPYREAYQYDLVLDAMETIVGTLKLSHLCIFEPQFAFSPTVASPPLYPPGRNEFGIKEYTMTAQSEGYGIPSTFWVTIFPHESYPNVETIHAYDVQAKAWLSWPDWLLQRTKEIESQSVMERFMICVWVEVIDKLS